MKKYLSVLLLCITLLTGCTNKTFDKAMEEGKLAVTNKTYEKAEGMFSLAVEENSNDKEANALHNQIQKLIEAIKLKEDGNIEETIKLCNDIEKIESESEIVKKESNILKEECNNKLEAVEKDTKLVEKELIEAEGLINNGKYNDAKAKLSEIINTYDGKSNLSSQIEKANNLISMCDSKKKEEESKNEVKSQGYKSKYISKLNLLEEGMSDLDYLYEGGITANMNEAEIIRYERWDKMLNEIYSLLKTQLTESEMKELKNKQLDWIKYRDETVNRVSSEGGSIARLESIILNADLTKERCYELVNTYMK